MDGRGLDTSTDYTGTVSLDPSSALSYTTSYTYTPNGDLASVTTPPITTLGSGGPTTGPVTTTDGYGTDGDLTSATSPNGATTATSYNHLGQVTKVTQPSVPLWNGGTTSPVETTSYDPDGNVVKQVDAAGDVSLSSYDPLGRLVASTNPVSDTTVYTYSATEQTATQDPQGEVSSSSYDAAGRLIQTVDPSGAVTQDAYDPAGNTTSITSTDSASDLLSLESRQYDALNRVLTDTVSGPTTAPQTTLTSYDPDGNVVQVQQPNGDVVFDTYTLVDQLETEEVDPATVMTATAPTFLLYSYNVVGNLSLAGDLDGRVTQNSVDAANRLIQSVATLGTTTITTTPQYDPDGNMLSQTTQTQSGSGPVQTRTVTSSVNALDWTTSSSDDGLLTSYGYDAAGQERTEAVLGGTQPVTTTLDAEGRATSIADGLSGTVAYSYNADDLPITVTLPGGLLAQPQYDGASRLITLTLSGPSGVSQPLSSTYGYAYSPLDWTTALTSTLNGLSSTQTLTHDAEGRLTGWSSEGSTQSWTYDGNGNLTLALSNTVPTTYTYGNGVPNELSKLQTPGQYTRKYAYDQQGDTTAITTTGSYSAALQYDSQARLGGVSFKSGQVITMTYNAAGQRASYSMTQPGQPAWSAQFQYRGDLLGQATVISGSQTYTDTYLYDQSGSPLELLRQQNGATNRYWYVLDGRSNVVALTDVTGNVVDRYAYDAWGVPTTSSETVPQRWRYAGYWYDQELGWYWVSVRSYDPTLKRWLQPDPSQQDGVRTFVYVGDDPTDETDPTGLMALTKPVPATPAPTPNPPPSATPTPDPSTGRTHGNGSGSHTPIIGGTIPFRGDTNRTWKSPEGDLRMAIEDLHVEPPESAFPGPHVNLQVIKKVGRAWDIVANWHVRLAKAQRFGSSWVKVEMEAGENYHNLQTRPVEGEGPTLDEAIADGKRKLATQMLDLMEEKGIISTAERDVVYQGLVGELEDAAVAGAEDAGAGLLDTVIDLLLSSIVLN